MRDAARADEWVRAGIISRDQARKIADFERTEAPPADWLHVPFWALGCLAVATVAVLVFLTVAANSPMRLGQARTVLLVLGAFGVVGAPMLHRSGERVAQASLLAGLSTWAGLAFADPAAAWVSTLPALLAVWALPFVELRPDVRVAALVLQWPVTLFAAEGFGIGDATVPLLAASVVYLGLTALALPRLGPWRQVPRAALCAVGAVTAFTSAVFFVAGPTPGRAVAVLVGAGLAAAAWWLLAPSARLGSSRLPAIGLDLRTVA